MCLWNRKSLAQNSTGFSQLFLVSVGDQLLNRTPLTRRAGAAMAGVEQVIAAPGEVGTSVVMKATGAGMLTAKAGTIGGALRRG